MHWCNDETQGLLLFFQSFPHLVVWLKSALGRFSKPHCCKAEHKGLIVATLSGNRGETDREYERDARVRKVRLPRGIPSAKFADLVDIQPMSRCSFPGCRAPAEYLGHTHLTNDPSELFLKGLFVEKYYPTFSAMVRGEYKRLRLGRKS